MEKKMNQKQKIALERIWRLFELAENDKEAKHSKRYITLAKRSGEKMRVSTPKELKEKYCKKCYSLKVDTKKEPPFLVVKCKDCGYTKRFGLEERTGTCVNEPAKKAKTTQTKK